MASISCAITIPEFRLDSFSSRSTPADRQLARQVDTQLLSRIATQDQQAMQVLYDRTSSAVYGLALRILRNAEDAEEVLTDVFLQVWRGAASYNPSLGTPVSWLLMIARSRAIDRYRSSRNRRGSETPIEETWEFADGARSPETLSMLSQEATQVRAALQRLNPRQRKLIELAFFQGMTHSELAEHTGQPLGTVKTTIRQGLLCLRSSMQEEAG